MTITKFVIIMDCQYFKENAMPLPDCEKIRRYDLLCSTIIAKVESALNDASYDRRYDETLPFGQRALDELLLPIDNFFAGDRYQVGYDLFQTIIYENFPCLYIR